MFQSDIASEKPGVLDCLKEGVCRLFKWGTPHSTRLLPIWQLILPTALYGVSVYIISSLVQSVVRWFISMKQHRQLQMVICITISKTTFLWEKIYVDSYFKLLVYICNKQKKINILLLIS